MEAVLLSLHVLAAILLVGPTAVTVSLFPRYAAVTTSAPGADRGLRSPQVARALHRITRVYGRAGVVVPAVGLALAIVQGRTTEVWILIAMALTAVAGAILLLRIAPLQAHALASPDDGDQLRKLGMLGGVFNLLWAVVVVLMIVRPGSDYS